MKWKDEKQVAKVKKKQVDILLNNIKKLEYRFQKELQVIIKLFRQLI